MINNINIDRNNNNKSKAFGIRLVDDIFYPLIYHRIKEKNVTIHADIENKNNVIIHFYKGNNRKCSYNQYVGNIVLLLDKKINNKIKIELDLKVEHNGTLSIRAYNTEGLEECITTIKNNLTSNLKKKINIFKNLIITFSILFFILIIILNGYFIFPHIKKLSSKYITKDFSLNKNNKYINKNSSLDKYNIINEENKDDEKTALIKENNKINTQNNKIKYEVKKSNKTASAFEEEVYLKDEEGRINSKIIYRKDKNNNKKKIRYYIYEYDENNNLIKISEYNFDDTLLTYYIFNYDENNNRTDVYHYDSNGNVIETE